MWRWLGGRFEVLRGPEISERFPDLAVQESDVGVLDLRSGYSEPHRYIPALKNKLEDIGVEIRENEAVVGFDLRNDRVNGRRDGRRRHRDRRGGLRRQRLDEPRALARRVSHAVQELRTREVRHQAFPGAAQAARRQRSYSQRLRAAPRTTTACCWARPSTTWDPTRCTGRISTCRNLTRTRTRCRSSRKTWSGERRCSKGPEWDYHTVGLISLAYDVKPVIGPVPGVDGLYVGAHFHSGGFAYNPRVRAAPGRARGGWRNEDQLRAIQPGAVRERRHGRLPRRSDHARRNGCRSSLIG